MPMTPTGVRLPGLRTPVQIAITLSMVCVYSHQNHLSCVKMLVPGQPYRIQTGAGETRLGNLHFNIFPW